MSEVERKVALERYKLLEPHLQNGRELRSVSEGSGVSFRTLQRWVSGYKREGLVGLVRKGRIDSGGRRIVTPRLREAIEGLALEKPGLPLTSVHRQAKQFAQLEVTTPNVENRTLRMLKLSSIASKLPQPGFIAADWCLPENEAAILRL